jgi:hypothetical protein
VDGFVDTPAGPVPRVRTLLSARDRVETAVVRMGYGRYDYKVVPGLYCVGTPTAASPVIVTGNYKLTFDAVRRELTGLDAWLLVTDTRGINIWCAAGKELFSTDEVAYGVTRARLAEVVSHRTLILPQLGATGVAAHTLRRCSGFSAVYGPVRAADLPAFINAGNAADEAMRTVTFTLGERAALVPVELFILGKPLAVALLASFLLSGIGPDVFSPGAAWSRGLAAACATLAGILAGCVAVPLLLPRLPWRHFSPKGALLGAAAGTLGATALASGVIEAAALVLWSTAVASYLAMNFTGSTPYTSPTGVEREMRRAIPVQAAAALTAIGLWLAAPFA